MNATANAETPLQQIVQLIEREAQKRFAAAKVDRVVVNEADDSDDEYLKVYIVVEEPDELDPDKLVGFIGRLRSVLEAHASEGRFPIVSYFSKAEAAELFPESR